MRKMAKLVLSIMIFFSGLNSIGERANAYSEYGNNSDEIYLLPALCIFTKAVTVTAAPATITTQVIALSISSPLPLISDFRIPFCKQKVLFNT